jgi:hypothetical protein
MGTKGGVWGKRDRMSKLERKSGGAGGNEKAGGWGAVGVV